MFRLAENDAAPRPPQRFVRGACAVYEMGLVSLNFSAADFLLTDFFKCW
jgi:hypothetical protein